MLHLRHVTPDKNLSVAMVDTTICKLPLTVHSKQRFKKLSIAR